MLGTRTGSSDFQTFPLTSWNKLGCDLLVVLKSHLCQCGRLGLARHRQQLSTPKARASWLHYPAKEKAKGSFEGNVLDCCPSTGSWHLSFPPQDSAGKDVFTWQGPGTMSFFPLRFEGRVPDMDRGSRAWGPAKPQASQSPALKGCLAGETRTQLPRNLSPPAGQLPYGQMP